LQTVVAGNPPKTILVFAGGLKHFYKRRFFRRKYAARKNTITTLFEKLVINTFAVLVAAIILQGHIAYKSPTDLIVRRPCCCISTPSSGRSDVAGALPLLIFTLGLFTLVINRCCWRW